jgi:hypothetical protein
VLVGWICKRTAPEWVQHQRGSLRIHSSQPQQFALVGLSSSPHSEACKALGASDGVIHSRVSLEVICFRAITNYQNTYGDHLAQYSSKTALSRAHREGMIPYEVYWTSRHLGISMESGLTVYRHPCGRGNSALSDAKRRCAVRQLNPNPRFVKCDRQGSLAFCMWASAPSNRSSAAIFLSGEVAPMIYLQERLWYVAQNHFT